jgi:hypothetical protein
MDLQDYLAGIGELYAAEVLGEALAWRAAMADLAQLALPYQQRFQALLSVAPPEDQPMVSFMVTHEAAVIRFAQSEATGEAAMDRELLPMLSYPWARYSGADS